MVDFVTGQPIVAVVGLKDHGHTWVLLVVVVVVEVHLTTYSTFPRGRRNGGYVVEGWLAKHPHFYSSTPFWVAIGTCAKPERSMPARRGLSIYSRRRDLQCLHEPGAGAGAGVGLPTYCKICRGVRCRLRNGWIGRRRERVPIPRYAVPHFFHGRSLRST